jgi:hypothetical protein
MLEKQLKLVMIMVALLIEGTFPVVPVNAQTKTFVTYTPVPWSSTTTYAINDMVTTGSGSSLVTYISLIPSNLNNNPASTLGTDWNVVGAGANSFTLNTLSGAVTLAVGSGLSITPSGNTITINLSTPLTINSFTGCAGTVELGYNIVNPAFTATYGGTPTSASITNTDGISSPTFLLPPYTSGTVTGTFSHAALATTTFTLTAGTATATCTDTWKPRIFGGVAASGATSTVTASGTTAVLSNSTAIASAGLGAETVGQVIGSYTPSGQAIYLLLTGGSHTFIDANTGFPMAFNAPITVMYTNVNGVTETKYLYQTTNSLYANFQPKIAS